MFILLFLLQPLPKILVDTWKGEYMGEIMTRGKKDVGFLPLFLIVRHFQVLYNIPHSLEFPWAQGIVHTGIQGSAKQSLDGNPLTVLQPAHIGKPRVLFSHISDLTASRSSHSKPLGSILAVSVMYQWPLGTLHFQEILQVLPLQKQKNEKQAPLHFVPSPERG